MIPESLTHFWLLAATDLDLDVSAPFVVQLSRGTSVSADALVRHWGASVGMLVSTDDRLLLVDEELERLGFGICVMDAPLRYERHDVQDLLYDWGWSHRGKPSPDWYGSW